MSSELHTLAAELVAAKKAEHMAKDNRIRIEEDLIALLGAKEEGSQSHDAGEYTVTITGKLNRSADWDELDKAIESVPVSMRPIKVKRELDTKGLRWLEAHRPDLYRVISKALIVKPAKTAVAIRASR